MILKIPRDIYSYPEYRRLETESITKAEARMLFTELWVTLGFQCSSHGKTGVFHTEDIEVFDRSTGIRDGVKMLKRAGILKDRKSRGLPFVFCELFAKFNWEIDKDHIPQNRLASAWQHFAKKYGDLKTNGTKGIQRKILKADLTSEQYNAAVVLVRTIDAILKFDDRTEEEWTPGLVQDAHVVCERTEEIKRHVFLKFFYVHRGGLSFPRDTGYVLRNWTEIVWKNMPNDGWVEWDKRKGMESGGIEKSIEGTNVE
jgi:hypothetical protein